jgi:hypothetical protein
MRRQLSEDRFGPRVAVEVRPQGSAGVAKQHLVAATEVQRGEGPQALTDLRNTKVVCALEKSMRALLLRAWSWCNGLVRIRGGGQKARGRRGQGKDWDGDKDR